MKILFILSLILTTSICVWFALSWLLRRYSQYQIAFRAQAREGLSEVFLFLDPVQVWRASVFLSVLTSFVMYLVSASLALALPAALLCAMIPQQLLRHVRRRRLAQMDQQLPDFLLALAGALRAGAGVQSAMRHIVEHMQAPLSQELQLMLREQRMGVAFELALDGFYRRVPTEGSSLVVSALRISAQSGGSLAETLERISATLRARLHLLGRVRALTSQGRMQAWIMAMLPVALAVVLHWLDPHAMSLLWSTPGGWLVLITVAVLEISGLFFIRRIVNIQV